jgi:ribosome-binding factor A
MPDDRRLLRLQQLILETVASTVLHDLDDPRIGMVTVTRVKLAKDLTQATIYWSTLAPDGPRRTSERGLTDALPVIQRAVAGALGTRQTPHLFLRFDVGLEASARIDDIFHKLAQERGEMPAGEAPVVPPPPADEEPPADADDDEE